MKFTWFNLMPWPHLPEDFTEKHRSVWVDISSTLFGPEVGHTVYNEYLDLLEYAEEVSFDGIGVNEHHSNAYGLMSSPNIMAAALARRASKAARVVLGNSLGLYNPPPIHIPERGYVIVDSPETVHEQMEDMIKGLRVGNVFAIMHTGDMPQINQAVWRKSPAASTQHLARLCRRLPFLDHPPQQDRKAPGPIGGIEAAE